MQKNNFKKERKPTPVPPVETEIRLNRYLANCGVCSRKKADDLIVAGYVKVNGKCVDTLGYKVSPTDKVTFKNKPLSPQTFQYVLLNKPKGFITTTDDPQERKTVMSLVKKACKEQIYPVGRLDRDTTGVLLFTNDGKLAQQLMHPSFEIKKIYQVELDKPITDSDFNKVLSGLTLEDGVAKVKELAVIGDTNMVLGLEIHMGKNRIVRRIFKEIGYDVKKLDRVMFGSLTKKNLKRGQYRILTESEVAQLKRGGVGARKKRVPGR